MNIAKLYQMKPVIENHNKIFQYYANVDSINLDDYDLVAEIEIDSDQDICDALEELFIYCNSSPEYREKYPEARSMSVSDIIKIDNEYFYCDVAGFENCTNKINKGLTEAKGFTYDITYADNNGKEQNYKLTTQTELNEPQLITKCKEYNSDFFKLLSYKKLNESLLKNLNENLWQDGSNIVSNLVDRAFKELSREDAQDFLQGIVGQIKEIADENGLYVENKKLTESEKVKTLYDLIIERGEGIDIGDITYDMMVYVDFDPDSNDDYDKFMRYLCKNLYCVSYTDNVAQVNLTDWVKDNFYELDQLFDVNASTEDEEIEALVTEVMPGVISGFTTDSVYEALLQQPAPGSVKEESILPTSTYRDLIEQIKEAKDLDVIINIVTDCENTELRETLDKAIEELTDEANASSMTHNDTLKSFKQNLISIIEDFAQSKITESKSINYSDLPQSRIIKMVKDGYKEHQDIKDNVITTAETIRDEDLTTFGNETNLDTLITFITAIANNIYYANKYDESKQIKTETTNTKLKQMKNDLNGRERQALKDLGDENYENLINLKQRMPEDMFNAFMKEEEEIRTIEMIHSILTYSPEHTWTVENVMDNRYLQSHIEELGKDKVQELVKQEIEEYKKNAIINKDVYTDGEGVTYSSVSFKNESQKLNESDSESNFFRTKGLEIAKKLWKENGEINTICNIVSEEVVKEAKENGIGCEVVSPFVINRGNIESNTHKAIQYGDILIDYCLMQFYKDDTTLDYFELAKNQTGLYVLNNYNMQPIVIKDLQNIDMTDKRELMNISFEQDLLLEILDYNEAESKYNEKELINQTAEEIENEVYEYVKDHGYDMEDYNINEHQDVFEEIDKVLENFTTNKLDTLESKTNKEYYFWYEFDSTKPHNIRVIIERV